MRAVVTRFDQATVRVDAWQNLGSRSAYVTARDEVFAIKSAYSYEVDTSSRDVEELYTTGIPLRPAYIYRYPCSFPSLDHDFFDRDGLY
jgi:hypothetical protein